MAISLQEAEKMIEATIKNKIKLLCGHTQSFGPHIRTMRKIIRSGELGASAPFMSGPIPIGCSGRALRTNWTSTKAAACPTARGRTRSTHSVLGGGMVSSVRGSTGAWFQGRPIPGYYSAFMEFADGTPATLMHNGYGYFLASELVPWGGQNSRYSEAERAAIRKSLFDGTRNENADKDECVSAAPTKREIRDRSKSNRGFPTIWDSGRDL